MASTSQIQSALNLFAHLLFTVTVVYFYLSLVTFSATLFSLFVLWFYSTFWWWDMQIYLVFSTKKFKPKLNMMLWYTTYRRADKSLARPGKKQAWKHVRDARDFINIETRSVIKLSSPLQGKGPKEIHAILTETLACFPPGRTKDLLAPQ